MADTFQCEILLPGKEVISTDVTEVVLPAHDGERGILAHHADFLGVLGIGLMKIVTGGDDYWLVVSSGVYFVRRGALTVLAEKAEEISEINADEARRRLAELEKLVTNTSRYNPGFEKIAVEQREVKARLEAVRRTQHLH